MNNNHGRTPNYALKEAYIVHINDYDRITLPAGSFIRPIEKRYVPKHVLEDKRWPFVDHKEEVFAYTRHGIFPIPRNKIWVP